MNTVRRILLALAAMSLLAPIGSAWAQGNAPIAVSKMFEMVKPGQWIRMEGTLQKDHSVLCTKVKLLSGAIQDDDWSMRGTVRSVDPAKRELTIGRYKIGLNEQPKFNSPMNTLKSLSDLRAGTIVKVEGTYHPDGKFIARKVNDETENVTKKPGLDKHIMLQGKVERAQATKKTIIVMGTPFISSEKTKITAVVK